MDTAVLISCLALVGTLLIVLLLLCRLIHPYDIAWFLSSREDKIHLSKMKLYNANGYLMHSGSEILLGSTGSFQRFDSVDRDYKPQYGPGSTMAVPPWRSSTEDPDIPPQPLRPAPSPKESKLIREKSIQRQISEPKTTSGMISISPVPRPVPRKQHSAPIAFPLPILPSPRDKRSSNFEPHIPTPPCTYPVFNGALLKEKPNDRRSEVRLKPMSQGSSTVSSEGQNNNASPSLLRLLKSANNPFLDTNSSGENQQQQQSELYVFNFEPDTVQSVFNQSELQTETAPPPMPEDDPLRRVEKRLSKMENLRKMSRLIESNQILLNIYQQFNSATPEGSSVDPALESMSVATTSITAPPLPSPTFSLDNVGTAPSSAALASFPETLPSNSIASKSDTVKYKEAHRTETGENIRYPTDSKSVKHILRNRSFSETEFSERKLFKSMALLSESEQSAEHLVENLSYKHLNRQHQATSASSNQLLQKTVSESFLEQYSLGRDYGGAVARNGFPVIERLHSAIPSSSSESVASQSSVIFSDLEPCQLVTGYLCVGLQYDKISAPVSGIELLVTIQEAKDLIGPPGEEMDTFVKVFIVPDESRVLQTKVFKCSCRPSYQETFSFWVTYKNIRRSLWFHVYHNSVREQSLIGEAELQINENFNRPITTWLKLTDYNHKTPHLGELMFSLSYLPTAERLTVVVVKARNLMLKNRIKRIRSSQNDVFDERAEQDGACNGNVFVKVYLLKNDQKISKKKTTVKRGERFPIYNEAIIFSVPPYMLNTIQIRLSVVQTVNRDTYDNSNGICQIVESATGKASFKLVSIGHVIVGGGTTGKGLRHWHQMLTTLRKPVTMWHALKTASEQKRKLAEPAQSA